MKQKEKGIFIGGENMVKCEKVRPLIYRVFIPEYKIAESMVDIICIYIYIVL